MPNTPHASCNASSFSMSDELRVVEVMEDNIVAIRFLYGLVLTGFGRFKGNAVFLSTMWGLVAGLVWTLCNTLISQMLRKFGPYTSAFIRSTASSRRSSGVVSEIRIYPSPCGP